jgi:hypothetical protein
MLSRARHIRHLREQSGRSHAEMAVAVGIGLPAYYDVEAHDDEVTSCLTLREAHRLAIALGVDLRRLLAPTDDPAGPVPTQTYTLSDLADRIRGSVEVAGLPAAEDAVGWQLDHVLADPAAAWEEPADFLRFVCEFLGLDWRAAIPNDPPPSDR